MLLAAELPPPRHALGTEASVVMILAGPIPNRAVLRAGLPHLRAPHPGRLLLGDGAHVCFSCSGGVRAADRTVVYQDQ